MIVAGSALLGVPAENQHSRRRIRRKNATEPRAGDEPCRDS